VGCFGTAEGGDGGKGSDDAKSSSRELELSGRAEYGGTGTDGGDEYPRLDAASGAA